MLAKLKIAQKLYLMTGLTLAFLVIASTIGFVGAINLGDLFKQARETSRASTMVTNIQEDFLEARLAALKYRAQREPAQAEAVASNLEEIEAERAATQEIASNAQEASDGTQQVTRNISGVSDAATEAGSNSGQVLDATGALSDRTRTLRGEVDRFLSEVKAA